MPGRVRRLLPATTQTRALALSDLINTIGTGLFVTGGTVFLLRWAGLSVREISLGLMVGGLVGLVLGLPIGQLVDRRGARGVAMAMLAGRAFATAALTLVHSLPALVAVASVVLVTERGGLTAFNALVAQVAGPERVRVQSYLRSVSNVGVSLGAAAAGVLLALDSRGAYAGLVLADAVALLISAVILRRVPRPAAARPAGPSPSWPVIHDRRYLTVAGMNGVLSLQYDVLAFAVPLWIITRTDVPPFVISVLLLLNTLMVVALQVRFSRNLRTVEDGARLVRRAGRVFVLSCGLIAITGGMSAGAAAGLLILATAVHSVGELWHAAGSFSLSFELAPEHAHGQYQAVFLLSEGAERALAPGLLGLLCFALAPGGWFLLAAVLVLVAEFMPAALKVGERGSGGLPSADR